MILRITKYGEPILREVGAPVTEFDDALAQLANDMFATMRAANGIGLAAQQVGRALQFFVIDLRPPEGGAAGFDYLLDGKRPPLDLIMPMALANPKITITDPTETTYEEGCLSFPEVRGNLDRPVGVRCAYQDLKGNPHVIQGNGMLGRCILHENDHLNGKLFIDTMYKRDLLRLQPRIRKIKRASRDFLKKQK